MNSLVANSSDLGFLCVVPSSNDVYVLRRAVRSRYVSENSETESDDDSKAAKKVKMDPISCVDSIFRAEEGVASKEMVTQVECDQIDVPTDEEGVKKVVDAEYEDGTKDDEAEGATKACEEVMTRIVIVISDSGSDSDQ